MTTRQRLGRLLRDRDRLQSTANEPIVVPLVTQRVARYALYALERNPDRAAIAERNCPGITAKLQRFVNGARS